MNGGRPSGPDFPRLRNFALRYGIFLGAFVAYDLVACDWALEFGWTQLLTEAPLLLYLFALLQLPLRNNRWRPFAAAIPLVFLYGVHDYFLTHLALAPNWEDCKLLPDFFQVLSFWSQVGVVALLGLPVAVWLLSIHWRIPTFNWKVGVLLLPAVFLGVSVAFFPGAVYESINAVTADEEWSDKATAERWGRLYSLFMREARRRNYLEELDGYTPLDRSAIKLDDEFLASLDKRNVHIIVLESFVDVRLFQNVKFEQSPLDEEFVAWADEGIGSSISPVFGGETSRAEFEILCGVPSLRLFGVEFLVFGGAPSYCLPNILNAAGYFTLLSFPYGPVFYNSKNAYSGLGFKKIIYADRFSEAGEESISIGTATYLFDGDLFDQNLVKVKSLLSEKKPFLNYVLTMYGHWPFDIDTVRHPLVVDVLPNEDCLKRLVGVTYYRTRALGKYVQRLIELDPRSLIILVGDHLPPLPRGVGDYQRLGFRSRAGLSEALRDKLLFENFLLLIVDGKIEKSPLMRHFDLFRWILDRLSGGTYCREQTCDFGLLPLDPKPYLDAYRTLLGLASRSRREY